MDNRTIDVFSEGDGALALAVELAWPNAVGGKATHYKIMTLKEETTYYGNRHSTANKQDPSGTPTLLLLWSDEREAIALPYPLELSEAIPFIAGWLKKASRGSQPDHDGDNGEGWRVFTESWGHVAGHHYAIVAIQPIWAMYGK